MMFFDLKWWVVYPSKECGLSKMFMPIASRTKPASKWWDYVSGPFDKGEAVIESERLNAKKPNTMPRRTLRPRDEIGE